MCAEASPDVFSAFAMSASGEASTDGKISFGAKFGLSSAETAATIARSQSINIIRESMYRTCERYLSGAISKTVFITQAARDQRSMIAFLAIEQLTGVAKPPATIISGPATSAALGAGAEAVKLVTDFRKSAIDAASAEAAAKIDFDKAKGNADCDKDLADDADDKTKTAYKACLDAKTKYAEKKAANEKAQTQLDQALKMGAATGALAEAKTETGQTNPGTGATPAAVSDNIAQAVVQIVTVSGINEALMFCIGHFTDKAEASNSKLDDACKDVLSNSVLVDAEAVGGFSFSAKSAAAKNLDYLVPDGTPSKEHIKKVQEALKSLGLAPSPKNILRATADPVLGAAVNAAIAAMDQQKGSE